MMAMFVFVNIEVIIVHGSVHLELKGLMCLATVTRTRRMPETIPVAVLPLPPLLLLRFGFFVSTSYFCSYFYCRYYSSSSYPTHADATFDSIRASLAGAQSDGQQARRVTGLTFGTHGLSPALKVLDLKVLQELPLQIPCFSTPQYVGAAF